jgi:hypothetical protein
MARHDGFRCMELPKGTAAEALALGPVGSRCWPTVLIRILRLAYEQLLLIILVEPQPVLRSPPIDKPPTVSPLSRSGPSAARAWCGRGRQCR